MNRWFRFYESVLSDRKVQMLSPELFKHWVNLLCLCSQNGGKLPSLRDIAFELGRLSESKAAEVLSKLHRAGLLDKLEDGFAPHNWESRQYIHKQDPTNSERQKRYRNRRKSVTHNGESNGVTSDGITAPDCTDVTYSEANASGADAPPDPAIAEREYFDRGKQVAGKSSGGLLAKLLKAKGGNVALARSAVEAASQKHNPSEYLAACCRDGPLARPLTEHQRKQQELKDIRNAIGSFSEGSSSGDEPDTRLLRYDPGGRPEGVRGGPDRAFADIPGGRR